MFIIAASSLKLDNCSDYNCCFIKTLIKNLFLPKVTNVKKFLCKFQTVNQFQYVVCIVMLITARQLSQNTFIALIEDVIRHVDYIFLPGSFYDSCHYFCFSVVCDIFWVLARSFSLLMNNVFKIFIKCYNLKINLDRQLPGIVHWFLQHKS